MYPQLSPKLRKLFIGQIPAIFLGNKFNLSPIFVLKFEAQLD